MTPFLAIAELETGQKERFAIIAIDPSKRCGGGCEGLVQSLHVSRAEAEAALAPEAMEICDQCNGAGGDNQHSICGKCNGSGGAMTSDSGSRPTGRDVKQARGEARQSGAERASPMTNRKGSSTMTDAKALVRHARKLREELNEELPNGVGNTIDALCDALEQSDAVMEQDTGVPASPSGHSAKPESVFPVSAVPASVPNAVTISGELYAFLMGQGPIDGTWFGDLNEGLGLRGRFWWRALLRCAAGWPNELASAIEARRAETQGGSVADESAVPERQTPEPSSIAPVQDDDAEWLRDFVANCLNNDAAKRVERIADRLSRQAGGTK